MKESQAATPSPPPLPRSCPLGATRGTWVAGSGELIEPKGEVLRGLDWHAISVTFFFFFLFLDKGAVGYTDTFSVGRRQAYAAMAMEGTGWSWQGWFLGTGV